MIVNQVVPGQEEGNCELLLRHAAGALATTPATVITTLRSAFADNGRGWIAWHSALESLARPDAARAIASHVLAHVGYNPREPKAGLSAALR
jgi:processive 1,2-diacylglycerol beta-glucosyltransferase